MAEKKNYYDILGVDKKASAADIRKENPLFSRYIRATIAGSSINAASARAMCPTVKNTILRFIIRLRYAIISERS